MKQVFLLLASTALILGSCKESFKKTTGGMEYKIISDGKGKKIADGNFFELSYDQTYKDSKTDTVLTSSKDMSNQLVRLDSTTIPPVYYKIFSQVRIGDSVIVKTLVDSIMKMGANLPPFMKKSQFIVAHYKIVNIYDNKAAADSAFAAQSQVARAKDSLKAAAQLVKDDKILTDYFSKNKITVVKAPKGTYVEVITPGEGDAIDTSKVVKVLYTGKPFGEDKAFDSNVDPQFGHTEAYPVYMNAPVGSEKSVIPGWTDGISMLKKGSKAKLYIPSSLAYGSRGRGENIKPDAILVFDVELTDVTSVAQAMAEEEIKMKQQQAQQKHAMDSIQKAAAKDSARKQ